MLVERINLCLSKLTDDHAESCIAFKELFISVDKYLECADKGVGSTGEHVEACKSLTKGFMNIPNYCCLKTVVRLWSGVLQFDINRKKNKELSKIMELDHLQYALDKGHQLSVSQKYLLASLEFIESQSTTEANTDQ
jgi:hypothetical protein